MLGESGLGCLLSVTILPYLRAAVKWHFRQLFRLDIVQFGYCSLETEYPSHRNERSKSGAVSCGDGEDRDGDEACEDELVRMTVPESAGRDDPRRSQKGRGFTED